MLSMTSFENRSAREALSHTSIWRLSRYYVWLLVVPSEVNGYRWWICRNQADSSRVQCSEREEHIKWATLVYKPDLQCFGPAEGTETIWRSLSRIVLAHHTIDMDIFSLSNLHCRFLMFFCILREAFSLHSWMQVERSMNVKLLEFRR